jgi:hypothetical protein
MRSITRDATLPSGEQFSPGLGELSICSGLVQCEPSGLDRQLEPGAVFRRRALVAEPKRAVDLLDIDLALLDGFEGLSVLHEAARSLFGSE